MIINGGEGAPWNVKELTPKVIELVAADQESKKNNSSLYYSTAKP